MGDISFSDADDDDIDTESDGDTDTSSDEYKTFLSGDLKKKTIQKVKEVVDELKKLKSMSCVRGFRALHARVEEVVVKKPRSEVKVTNCILGLRARNAPDVRCSKHETRSVNLSVGVQFLCDDYRILLADIDVEVESGTDKMKEKLIQDKDRSYRDAKEPVEQRLDDLVDDDFFGFMYDTDDDARSSKQCDLDTWMGDEMDEKQNEVDWQEDSYHGVDEVEDLFDEFDQAIKDALLQEMIYKTCC
ncbi:hypothetical protein Tco_0647504 [Tanacetum coccineum]